MTAADLSLTLPACVRLTLTIREPEVVLEINKFEDGMEREQFALSALRIGVLALRQASGVVDANAVRAEGERLVGSVRELLSATALPEKPSANTSLLRLNYECASIVTPN
jgi:hypothetical protein